MLQQVLVWPQTKAMIDYRNGTKGLLKKDDLNSQSAGNPTRASVAGLSASLSITNYCIGPHPCLLSAHDLGQLGVFSQW